MTALDGWHEFVRSRGSTSLHDLLDPDVTFDSPVVHTTQRGRAITHAYLSAAASVLGGPDFRYTGEWRSNDGAVLEFETIIDGIAINGVDIIRLADDGARIIAFKVMIRPLQAVQAVHRLMGEMLARAAAQRSPSATSSESGVNGSSPDPG